MTSCTYLLLVIDLYTLDILLYDLVYLYLYTLDILLCGTSCTCYLPFTYTLRYSSLWPRVPVTCHWPTPLDILLCDLVYMLLAIDLYTLDILLCDLVYLLLVIDLYTLDILFCDLMYL